VRRGCSLDKSGFYTQDPLFAEAVHEAIALGYKLAPYEMEFDSEPNDVKEAGGNKRQNYCEAAEAKKLKSIFDKDKTAKVFVWAGRGHVYREAHDDKSQAVSWKPMAYIFRELTGIDPLTLVAVRETELGSREKETPEYKYADWNGWLNSGPTMFVDANGKAFAPQGAIDVFLPRQNLHHGRADWLEKIVGRVEVPIPSDLISAKGTQLAEAYYKGDLDGVVPIDRILIKTGEPPPVLMLPRGAEFIVRVSDSEGKLNGKASLNLK
jgi:hypothetical protein